MRSEKEIKEKLVSLYDWNAMGGKATGEATSAGVLLSAELLLDIRELLQDIRKKVVYKI